ncbi:hypothetical protein PAMP_023580 [Pampus punctatissimus]
MERGREMFGSLAGDPGGLSSLGGQKKQIRVVDDGEKEEEERGGGSSSADAAAPRKEGKEKCVPIWTSPPPCGAQSRMRALRLLPPLILLGPTYERAQPADAGPRTA